MTKSLPALVAFSFFLLQVLVLVHFSRGHATLHLAVSVGTFEIFLNLQVVFALLLLPNRPRLDCRVSGLVSYPLQMFPEEKKL